MELDKSADIASVDLALGAAVESPLALNASTRTELDETGVADPKLLRAASMLTEVPLEASRLGPGLQVALVELLISSDAGNAVPTLAATVASTRLGRGVAAEGLGDRGVTATEGLGERGVAAKPETPPNAVASIFDEPPREALGLGPGFLAELTRLVAGSCADTLGDGKQGCGPTPRELDLPRDVAALRLIAGWAESKLVRGERFEACAVTSVFAGSHMFLLGEGKRFETCGATSVCAGLHVFLLKERPRFEACGATSVRAGVRVFLFSFVECSALE